MLCSNAPSQEPTLTNTNGEVEQIRFMSSTHKSSTLHEGVLKLDASGNIDANKLSKEATDALAFDIDYKKKDNMKKRAIKSAPDYDTFRNMVACASLKTVR